MNTLTARALRLATFVSLTSLLPVAAENVAVAGMTFTPPEAFQPVKPKSAMRKAQFVVGEGEQAGEIVFFYFGAGGAGGVDANVKRWFAQFKEPLEAIAPKTEKTKAGEIPVTFVSAQGTFKSGPPRGPAVLKPDYALLGAIVEAKQGAIFAKFTGPKATVDANTEVFKKMITEAK